MASTAHKPAAQRFTVARMLGMVATVFATFVGVPDSASAADLASEAAVKAAFVYNFAKFVEWQTPTDVKSPNVRICVAGIDGELANSIGGLEGKPVQARTVSIRREPKVGELDACQILFVGIGARPLAETSRGKAGLLTVSDMKGFAAAGGVIELFAEDGRMRFEINLGAAQRAGLRISSQLLKLAKVTPEQ